MRRQLPTLRTTLKTRHLFAKSGADLKNVVSGIGTVLYGPGQAPRHFVAEKFERSAHCGGLSLRTCLNG